MSEMKFTQNHEWLRSEDDGTVTIGITDYAQDQLGDIVYVELPEVGREYPVGECMVVIESVKAVGEIELPAAGSIVAVNENLVDEPEQVNSSPLEQGWLVRIQLSDPEILASLLDASAYQAFVDTLT